mmetsp:Transcript_34426/g.44395  ORF Transcript_34426/g.44395 Transcript_34426/m.44395 type:complete len:157 (+) Transcript_34426:2-472(+)
MKKDIWIYIQYNLSRFSLTMEVYYSTILYALSSNYQKQRIKLFKEHIIIGKGYKNNHEQSVEKDDKIFNENGIDIIKDEDDAQYDVNEDDVNSSHDDSVLHKLILLGEYQCLDIKKLIGEYAGLPCGDGYHNLMKIQTYLIDVEDSVHFKHFIIPN